MRVELRVNGERHRLAVDPAESLLYVLRERLGLLGSKNACEQGECGSCTVLVGGRPVCACLVLAGALGVAEVVTVEGLGDDPVAGAVRQAMVEAGAIQCGFCTPGLVVQITDLLRRQGAVDEAGLREALSGNLCRCTGYLRIFEAVRLAGARIAATEARA